MKAPVKQELNLKATGQIVELFSKSKSVPRHQRLYRPGRSMIAEQIPTAHREYLGWSPERLVSWARKSGEHTDVWRSRSCSRAVIRSRATGHAWVW